MKIKITKLKEVGFCYGVKRAIEMLEKTALECGSADCLGELVHNPEVMYKLAEKGIKVIKSPQDCSSPAIAISAHGVSPELEAELANQKARLVDATCPSVKKVQLTAKKLAKNGFTVIIYGDAGHSEVKGILGFTAGNGLATTDKGTLFAGRPWPRKIGILSQTTQAPENYLQFVKDVLDGAMTGNSEITVLDTICREVRRRQSLSQNLAAKSDLMIVVGGKNSANSRRLAELCSASTDTHLIETADEIDPAWLKGKQKVGITAGTSTSEHSINEVVERLEQLVNPEV